MKKLILIILSFISLTAYSQTVPTLPAGAKPYGNQLYIIPSTGLIYGGNVGYQYRVIGTKKYVDSLNALNYSKIKVDSIFSTKLSNAWLDAETTVISDAFHNAFPGLTKDNNGKLYAVYRKATTHDTVGHGSIVMKTSVDTGKTWTSEIAVKTSNGIQDYRDPSITYLANGSLIINYFMGTGTLGSLRVFTIKSTDGGVTWGTPVQFGGYSLQAAVSAPIIQLQNGNLLVPTYGNDGGVYKTLIFRSTDNGNTWSAIGNMATGTNYVEPNIILLPDGRVMGSIRNESTTKIAINYSSDGGVTWTSPVDKFDGQSRTTLAFSDGDVIFSYRSWDGATKSIPALRVSSDYGVTFTAIEANLPIISGADNYSAITKISGNTYAFIYSVEETGTVAPIYFRKMSFPVSASVIPSISVNGLVSNNTILSKRGGIVMATNSSILSSEYLSTGFLGFTAGQNSSFGAGIRAYGYSSPTARGKLVLSSSTGFGGIVFSGEGVTDTTGFAEFARNGDLTMRTGRLFLPLAAAVSTEPIRKNEFDASNALFLPLTAGLSKPLSGNLAFTPVSGGIRYIASTGGGSNDGSLLIQHGGGSSAQGGVIQLFGHSSPTRPGWVSVAPSNGSGGKFSVDASPLGGSPVFTVDATGLVNMVNLTASRLMGTDASKNLVSLTPTTTEANYLSGVTSGIQAQINTKAPSASPVFTNPTTATAPSSGNDITNKTYVDAGDALMLPLTAGTSKKITGDLVLSVAAAGNKFIALDGDNTSTRSMTFQAGLGSATFGGGMVLYGNSHASFPGWVKVGMSSGSGGKFAVNSSPLGNSTDVFTVDANGLTTAIKYKLSALNTAPSSATDTGALGEIRIDANYIYFCFATNQWKRSPLTTWP